MKWNFSAGCSPRLFAWPCVLASLLASPLSSPAQITNTVFSDDFSGASIDTNKWVPDAPMFEGGKGTITPQQHDGVVEFTGVVTEQWWAGATLRALPTFPVSAETNVIVTVDRVAEQGYFESGSSTRSALWIMDGTKSKYVLFADNQNESHWEYNRYIGQSGDVRTGPGTAIPAFNTAALEDEGLHQMKAVANGKTVRLFLDGKAGPEIKFPFNSLVFQIGSYARSTNDQADTIFDNFTVQTVGAEAFSATSLTLLSGQTTTNVTVRIPRGVNATKDVAVRVRTSDPTIAIPAGAVGDTLTLTFASGAPNEQVLGIKSLGPVGSAQLTLANDIGMNSANTLSIVVILGPGMRLTEDFSGSEIDTNKWMANPTPFEPDSMGTFTAGVSGGALVITGTVDSQPYWPGLSLQTVPSFTATADLPLVFEMDRVSMDPTRVNYGDTSTGSRTGVFIETVDRSQFVFFSDDIGTSENPTNWVANVTPTNPTGAGTALPELDSVTDTNSHHVKIVADGTSAELFLDGVSGGKFDFPVSTGIYFDLGAYAREYDDSVVGVFDNVKIQNVFPPVTVAPSAVSTIMGLNASYVTVTIPRLLNLANPVTVTVATASPTVANPEGALDGRLTLTFPAGGTNVQSFRVITAGVGTTVFTVTCDQPVTIANNVNVTVTPPPEIILTDDFSSDALNTNTWVLDSTPLIVGGTLKPESSVFITNGVLEMYAWCDTADWPGFALLTKPSYAPSAQSPVVFEVDRVKMEYKLIGGNVSKERTGVWVKSGTNYVFFSELGSWDTTANGWQYNRLTGRPGDNPVTADGAGGGVYLQAFSAPGYLDQGNHHLRAEANGASVKLYLDGTFGAEVPFPFTNHITFGLGSYANFSNGAGNPVWGFFDNATVLGYPSGTNQNQLIATRLSNGDILLTWTGIGALQSATALGGTWAPVTPAPTGNSYLIPAASLSAQQYFRLLPPPVY